MAQHHNQSERSVPNFLKYRGLWPGLMGIGVIVAARLAGLLQPLEWAALDVALRWRPPEPMDEHVVIVNIDENDIQSIGTYPIPDQIIAQLLLQLQDYDVRVVGLDVVRNLPVNPGHAELVEVFQSTQNIIGAESVVPDRFEAIIDPPSSLPPNQIGFVDNILDADGNIRRSLLGAATTDGDYQFSMPIRLAMSYLEPHGIELKNGIRDPAAMRFGQVELPRVYPNTGGYVRADAGGVQTMLNFRSGSQPFRRVSLTDVLEGEANPEWFRDRIVLIGITSMSVKDIVQSSAVRSSNPGLVFGVEVMAHATSQIVNAVLEGRSLLYTWSEFWEYAWIMTWGIVGIALFVVFRRPLQCLIAVIVFVFVLIGMSAIGLLVFQIWIPFIPAALVFALLSLIGLLESFLSYDYLMRLRIVDRQMVIEQTFTTIHNGPLQTLAALIRRTDDATFSRDQLRQDLQNLNQELRGVYETIRQEAMQDGRDPALYDLTLPLHELLYQVYSDTLQRPLPFFASLKVHITKFEPFDERALSPEQKRNLCRFLEESLCNVGKHAAGVKRLTVECRHDGDANVIRVVDNGIGVANSGDPREASGGWGTKQATTLARQLGGSFERTPNTPKGTRCELRWRPRQSLRECIWQQFQTQKIAGFGKSTR